MNARCESAFRGRQILAPLELIVLVAGALGEHRAEHFDVWRDGVLLAAQARGEALLEVPGGRVKRMIEVVRVDVEQIAVRPAEAVADVDDIEPGPRRELEGNLDRRYSHGYGLLV